MSSSTYLDSWQPIEFDSNVVARVLRDSAVERVGSRVDMNAGVRRVMRSAGLTVTAGTSYSADASTLDYITLTAARFIAQVVVDEDDLADSNSFMNVVEQRGSEWASSYADVFDNACLAVTGGTAPFESVYKNLRTTQSGLGYTADDNYLTWDDDLVAIASPAVGTSFYEKASATLEKVERGTHWALADSVVIAHPGYRSVMRTATDNQGQPIFVQGLAGTPDTLFGIEIAWSRGAKTSVANSGNPTGNDLLVFCGNRNLLKVGVRSGPEVMFDAARAQDSVDDAAIKFRSRRAFAVGHPAGFAVLERISD